MNERIPMEHDDRQREITAAEKEHFVALAREKAPHDTQPIDPFGSYTVNYEHDTSYLTIHIPVETEEEPLDEDGDISLQSDAVVVQLRDEEVIDERYTQVRSRQYIVHMSDMSADYHETTRIYDKQADAWAQPEFTGASMQAALNLYDTQQQLGVTVFTRERFDEACTVLQQLDPTERW